MRYLCAEIIAGCLVLATGCNTITNTNTNTNLNTNVAVNRNANANTNVNANAGDSTRRAPTREEYERNKESYAQQAKEAGRKIGSGLDDGWLWVKARFDLAAADDLRDSTINVDVDNNVVTLTGSVATADQKKRAEQVAKSVEGVKSVKNMLKVQPATQNANAASANANQRRK